MSTMDASRSKMRRLWGGGIGVGVVRGVDRALECSESCAISDVLVGLGEWKGGCCFPCGLHSPLGDASPIIVAKALFVPTATEAMVEVLSDIALQFSPTTWAGARADGAGMEGN